MLYTQRFTLALNELSNSPVEVTRAMLFLVVHHTHVNTPQRTILPSSCRTIDLTEPFTLGSKLVSKTPFEYGGMTTISVILIVNAPVTYRAVVSVDLIQIFADDCVE